MRLILSLFLVAILSGCFPQNKTSEAIEWYKETKGSILKDSDDPTTVSLIDYYENGKLKKVSSIKNGQPIVIKYYRIEGEQSAETHFSPDSKFELRKELCADGSLTFEGIFYKAQAIGLSTWWKCGRIEKQGNRWNGERIGVWKEWDENGLAKEVDYKNDDKLDSIIMLKY
ncbi:MAG: hypothetical protein JWO92_432 [Chitinophagaceae bacterium]|nr:hypothetical protein [Chitinophagaceae bacterium]